MNLKVHTKTNTSGKELYHFERVIVKEKLVIVFANSGKTLFGRGYKGKQRNNYVWVL